MFKSPLFLFAAILLFVVCTPLVRHSSAQNPPAKSSAKPNAEAMAKAKSIYQIDCAICHGDNGNGQTDVAKSMDLTLGDWTNPATLAGKPDSDLFALIRNGKDKMPPEDKSRASDAEVSNLIAYIRSLGKAQSSTPAPPTNLTATPQ